MNQRKIVQDASQWEGMVGIQCAENLTPSSSVACPLNIAAFPFCSKILIARMSTPRSMPASSAKNKGEQGFLFMYKLDVIEACVMQEAHTHQQQQHLVVQEMTDLYAHFTWIKSERERKSTMEKSTRKNDGQHIWHPYREAFKEINLKEEHQSPEPRVSSPDMISSNVITLSSIPFSRTCNHVCIRFVYNITLLSTYHVGHRERERESERGLEITAVLSLLPNLYDSHTVWWKGTTDLETISFFLFTKKDRTMGNTYKRKK